MGHREASRQEREQRQAWSLWLQRWEAETRSAMEPFLRLGMPDASARLHARLLALQVMVRQAGDEGVKARLVIQRAARALAEPRYMEHAGTVDPSPQSGPEPVPERPASLRRLPRRPPPGPDDDEPLPFL